MAEQKGYAPTRRHLEKARRRGSVLKSPLLTQSICIVATTAAFSLMIPWAWVKNRMLLEYCWSQGFFHPEQCAGGMGKILLVTVFASLIFAALVSIIAEGLQVGFRFDASLFSSRASIFDVGAGIRRMASGLRCSWQSLLRLVLSCLVFVWFLSSAVELAAGWFVLPWHSQIPDMIRFVLRLGLLLALTSVFFGALEYLVRRKTFYRELSMSYAELQLEQKEDAGDPQVRAVRHALHQAMSLEELVSRTRKSKVVIVERSE